MASALSSKASLFVGGGREGAVLNDTGMPEPAAAQEVCFVLQNGHNEMSSRDIPQDFMSFTPTSKTGRAGVQGGSGFSLCHHNGCSLQHEAAAFISVTKDVAAL